MVQGGAGWWCRVVLQGPAELVCNFSPLVASRKLQRIACYLVAVPAVNPIVTNSQIFFMHVKPFADIVYSMLLKSVAESSNCRQSQSNFCYCRENQSQCDQQWSIRLTITVSPSAGRIRKFQAGIVSLCLTVSLSLGLSHCLWLSGFGSVSLLSPSLCSLSLALCFSCFHF